MKCAPSFPDLPKQWVEKDIRVSGKFFLRCWHKKNWGKGRTLFIVHGFGEHSQRYEHFPHYLQDNLDNIIAMDLPGHGQSKGARGHCESFSEIDESFVNCFEESLSAISKETTITQSHIFGHSFGGLTVLHTFLNFFEDADAKFKQWEKSFRLRSLIVSAPLLGLALEVPPIKKAVGEFIEPYLGWVPLKNEISNNVLSHDPEVGPTYLKDPLNHAWITPRMFVQMNKAMKEVCDSKLQLPCPFMGVIPLDDRIVSATKNQEILNAIAVSSDNKKSVAKKIVEYPDFFHESFNESEKEKPFSELNSWIGQF